MVYLIADDPKGGITLEEVVRGRLEIADRGYGRKVLVRSVKLDRDEDLRSLPNDLDSLVAASVQGAKVGQEGQGSRGAQADIPFTFLVVVDLGSPDLVKLSLSFLHQAVKALEELRSLRAALMANAAVRVVALLPHSLGDEKHRASLWAWVKEVNYLTCGRFVPPNSGESAPKPFNRSGPMEHAGSISDIILVGPTNYHAARNPSGLKTLAPGGDRTLQWQCAAEIIVQCILRSGLDKARETFTPDQRTGLYSLGVASVGFAVEPVQQAFAAHRLAELIQTYLEGDVQGPSDEEITQGLRRITAEKIVEGLKQGGFDHTEGNVFESVFSRLVLDPKAFVKPQNKDEVEWSRELPVRILHYRDILEKTHYAEALRQIERVREKLWEALKRDVDSLIDRYVGVVDEKEARGSKGRWRWERARVALRKVRQHLVREIAKISTTPVEGSEPGAGDGGRLANLLNEMLSVFSLTDFGKVTSEVEGGPGSVERYYEDLVTVVRNQPLPEAVWCRHLAIGFAVAVGLSFAAEVNQYAIPVPVVQLGWFGFPAFVFPVVAGVAVGSSYWKVWWVRRHIARARDRLIIAILKDFRRRLAEEILGAARNLLERLLAYVGDPDDLQNRDPKSLAARLDEWKEKLANQRDGLRARQVVLSKGVEGPFLGLVCPDERSLGYGRQGQVFDPVQELDWFVAEVRPFSDWRQLAIDEKALGQAVERWVEELKTRGYGFLNEVPFTDLLGLVTQEERKRLEEGLAATSFPFLDVPPHLVGQLIVGEAVVCEGGAREKAGHLFTSLAGLQVAPSPGWKAISRLQVFGGLVWRLVPALTLCRSSYLNISVEERNALHSSPEFAEDGLDPYENMSVTYPWRGSVEEDLRL